MSKRNEDSVESFFRKAVNQYDDSFLAEDWQKMEKLLDQEVARRAAIRSRNLKRTAISGGALTLIAILVYFLAFDQLHPETRLVTDNSNRLTQAAEGLQAPTSANTEKVSPTAALLSPEQKAEDIQQNHQSNGTKSARKSQASDSRSVTKEESIVEGNDKRTRQGRENPLSGNTGNKESKNISVGEDKKPAEIRTPLANSSHDNLENRYTTQAPLDLSDEKVIVPSQTVEENKDRNLPAAGDVDEEGVSEKVVEEKQLVAQTGKESDTQPAKESKEKQRKRMPPSRWNIALAIAPDFSTTRLTRYSAPGEAYGLLIGYQFLNRFAISSGAVKSSKKYTGDGSDYQPPEGYWQRRTNGIIPNSIVGQCEVIEIPITLQYIAFEREKSRAYISGGVSSYLMLSEQYEYHFEQTNPGAAQGWKSSESSTHKFGIGHFSIGYERLLASRLAVGVEPFVKVPFTGIGWSRIDLFTTGAYLKLRYRILRKENVKDTN